MSEEKSEEHNPYVLKKVTFEFEGRGARLTLEGGDVKRFIEAHKSNQRDLVPISENDVFMENPVTGELGFLPGVVISDARIKRLLDSKMRRDEGGRGSSGKS